MRREAEIELRIPARLSSYQKFPCVGPTRASRHEPPPGSSPHFPRIDSSPSAALGHGHRCHSHGARSRLPSAAPGSVSLQGHAAPLPTQRCFPCRLHRSSRRAVVCCRRAMASTAASTRGRAATKDHQPQRTEDHQRHILAPPRRSTSPDDELIHDIPLRRLHDWEFPGT